MSETKLPKISEDDAEKPPQKDAQIKTSWTRRKTGKEKRGRV